MEQLLNRPEFQSAVIPFVVAMLVFLGLRKLTATAWVWALFTAFLISAGLINGMTFSPLTGTRKIILLVLASLILAGVIPYLIRQVRLQRAVVPTLAILALAWVFGKVVARMDSLDIALFLAGGLALVLFLVWAFERIASNDSRLHSAGFTLLLGSGLSATAAASALLGQLALSISAASGGILLAWVLQGKAVGGSKVNATVFILPYVLSAALLGLAAVIFAQLSWYALIPLAAIPLATSLVPVKPDGRFLSALVNSMPGLIIALATSYWVWQGGSSTSSGY